MSGHDGDEHDGHCARRTAHLDIAAAEHCGQDARDDCRRDSGRRADAGRDAEAEREGERDEGDHEPCGEVAPDGRAGPIRLARYETSGAESGAHRPGCVRVGHNTCSLLQGLDDTQRIHKAMSCDGRIGTTHAVVAKLAQCLARRSPNS